MQQDRAAGCAAGIAGQADCGCLPCAQGRAQALGAEWTGSRVSGHDSEPWWIEARSSSRERQRHVVRNAFADEAEGWELGDPFVSGALDCHWTVAGYAIPLYDPLPCTSTDGSIAPTDLGYHLEVASTCTVKLSTGVYRTYFAYPKLNTVGSERFSWPVRDGYGTKKFTLEATGEASDRWEDNRTWWNPDEATAAVADRCFTPAYISFLDSTDGVSWPLSAPQVSPTSGTTCEDATYVGATPVFSSGSFRSGWKSTAIPSSGAVVTYRDPSVVYLKGWGRYLMFVVRCDGTGRSPAGGDVAYEVEPGQECNTCEPSSCLSSTDSDGDGTPDESPQPTTDLVFFSCPTPEFQAGVSGPFKALAMTTDHTRGLWIGVPQALLTPDGDYVLVHAVVGGSGGLWAASLKTLGRAVDALEATFLADPATPYDDYFQAVAAFQLLGDVTLRCSDALAPIDPHFVFSPDGVLNLFFTQEGSEDELRYVSQARASASYDADTLAVALGEALPTIDPSEATYAPIDYSTTTVPGTPVGSGAALPPGWAATVFGTLVPPYWLSEAVNRTIPGTEITPATTVTAMFLDMTVTDCPPIDAQELIGSAEYTDPNDPSGVGQVPSVHDPEVFVAADGTVQMLFYAFSGLIRAWADPDDVWNAPLATC